MTARITFNLLLLLTLTSAASFAASETKQMVDSINALPHAYLVSNGRKAVELFKENAERARSIDYTYGQAKAYAQLSLALNVLGKIDERTSAILKAIKRFEQLGPSPDLAAIYGHYGYAQRKRDMENAIRYMKKGIRLAEKNQYRTRLTSLYDDYGVLHEQRGNLDSARYFYERALKVKYALQDSNGIPYSLNNIAGIYAMQGLFDKALEYAAESDTYRKKEKGEYGRSLNLMLYGEIYVAMGKSDSAVAYFKRCLKKCHTLNFTDLARYAYLKLTQVYEQTGDYRKALTNQKKYIAFKDSLLNISTNAKIAELEIAYETEKKDRKIAEHALALRKKTAQLTLALLAIIALAVVSLFIYRWQKAKRERLRKELVLKNKLKQSELEKNIADEKLRISRELHDNIGSHLTFLINSVDNLSYSAKESNLQEKLQRLSTFGRSTIKELRHSIWALKQQGGAVDLLVLKINELKQQINSQPGNPYMEVQCQINQSYRFSAVQILNLYRLVQEAVQNTLKHAEADHIQVTFEKSVHDLVLVICDDGKGFDIGRQPAGNGLRNMELRCMEAGGRMVIQSSEDGTHIICRIPIKVLQAGN